MVASAKIMSTGAHRVAEAGGNLIAKSVCLMFLVGDWFAPTTAAWQAVASRLIQLGRPWLAATRVSAPDDEACHRGPNRAATPAASRTCTPPEERRKGRLLREELFTCINDGSEVLACRRPSEPRVVEVSSSSSDPT